jgi:cyclopropane-fatty-acyl-phospholipid synthase
METAPVPAAHRGVMVTRARHAAFFFERMARARVERALGAAGVHVDGDAPWDPQLVRSRALLRVALGGTLGAGEAYVDGDWECAALDELSARLARHEGRVHLDGSSWRTALAAKLVNHQTRARAARNGVFHYDLGTELYEAMLGPSMTYSCGYWRDAATLEEAQGAKFALIARKLHLRPGHRLLDIGCGWGSFARYAADLGATVVGVTVSPEQAAYARERCRGLPVEIRLEDYRELSGRFDRIASIGMFEHVGPHNYRNYMRVARRCLSSGGLFLLHSIGSNRSTDAIDPWIDHYVFPGAHLPSVAQIARASEGLFVVEDLHNFGADYDRTLMSWRENFDAAWGALRSGRDERFRRRWRYYLSTCAGLFRARRNQLWQVVLSVGGVPGGYAPIR